MNASSAFEVDDRFLRQVYRLTLILAVVTTPILWAVYGPQSGLSFAIGNLVSLSALLSLEFVIRRLIKPGGSAKIKRVLGFIALGKYTVIFVGFYFLMKANWLNVYALAAGIGLVQIVIILKAVKIMTQILFKSDTAENEKHHE